MIIILRHTATVVYHGCPEYHALYAVSEASCFLSPDIVICSTGLLLRNLSYLNEETVLFFTYVPTVQ